MLSLMRTFSQSCQGQLGAPLSITCRGKPVARRELFAYTNGHFLVDEENQFRRRYVRFDLDALCSTAALAGEDPSRVTAIEKMEGGFSKAFRMKRANGTEVIAKIPCRMAGPPSLTTAGEVAVLEYVKKHTSILVPRVFAWSSDSSNPVAAEYIVMEKAPGVPLFQVWGTMTEFEKLRLIKNLTQLEAQLATIKFPVLSFCIGPSCDRAYNPDMTPERNQGPWNSVSDLGISIAERELCLISIKDQRRQLKYYRGTPEQQSQLLEVTRTVMKIMNSNDVLQKACQPTLWHTDLHMGNIFVNPNQCSQIVSLIDFQSTTVLPAFPQARWPIFLQPPRNYDYTRGIFQPQLPEDFDKLDEESQLIALREWSQVKLAKAYEVSTYLEDRAAHDAMSVPRVFRELFTRCGEVSEVGIVPLRACLIEIWENWTSLGFSGECPYSFSQAERDEHERQFAEYQAWHEVRMLAEECLDTDAEGWIAPQVDIDEKRRQNDELLALYIEKVAGERSTKEAQAMWPFFPGP
ncbi:hypothetical protein POX_e06576 [Penicillium oxalicum]|uniref:hypothetical protein n=1 Tax=Penicillium oxalicum TaxID=69781 RepID=UPI0020B8CAAF|nr:hypothetical protein POX_e06576 [Penicillium oxalicum]KAI2788557.1 hypothetical protein POX_e06576 [Penicillium oxalicum]